MDFFTWFAFVEITALARFAGALGYQDVEVPGLANFPKTSGWATHTAAGQRATFTWWSVALD